MRFFTVISNATLRRASYSAVVWIRLAGMARRVGMRSAIFYKKDAASDRLRSSLRGTPIIIVVDESSLPISFELKSKSYYGAT